MCLGYRVTKYTYSSIKNTSLNFIQYKSPLFEENNKWTNLLIEWIILLFKQLIKRVKPFFIKAISSELAFSFFVLIDSQTKASKE